MASSSQPAFLPPSVGGPSNRLKEYTKLLVESAQTSLITKFERYMEEHPLRPGQDKRDRISTFITSVDDKQERTKALHFLLEHYEDADYTRTGRWLQCAYCKKWHTRHNTLPMIPASDIDNWHCAHVNLCHACLMANGYAPRRMATHRKDLRGAQRATPSPSTRDSRPDTDQKPTSSPPVT